MDFACVDLVEQLHKNKCVEDDREVNGGPGGKRSAYTTLGNSKEARFEKEEENNNELREFYISEILKRSTW